MNSVPPVQPENWPGHVLVLANDRLLITALRLAFNPARVCLRHASEPDAAAEILAAWQPDLAIADADLDRGRVIDWLASTAAGGSCLPAIALTRSGDLADRLRALERGADDVLVIPFALEELLARARALIRRSRCTLSVMHMGQLEVDVLRRQARLNGVDLRLTPLEHSLLYLLASNAGRILTRDAILNAIWGSEYAADSNLIDRHVRNLRTKIGDSWRQPRFIATVPGQGYRFMPHAACSPPQAEAAEPDRRSLLELAFATRPQRATWTDR
jgi:two-component system, OmpR family, KDP operon response regulator KdpE